MLLYSNLGIKPTWLQGGERGNSVLEADPRIPPNPNPSTTSQKLAQRRLKKEQSVKFISVNFFFPWKSSRAQLTGRMKLRGENMKLSSSTASAGEKDSGEKDTASTEFEQLGYPRKVQETRVLNI